MRPASEVAPWQTELDGLIADVSLAVGKYVRACERSSGMADEPEKMRKAQMNLREWVAKLLEARDAEVRAAAELPWRRALWLMHGHGGLYGDDGEMQCSQCREAGYDYKRGDPDEVIAAAVKGRQETLAARVAEVRAATLKEAARGFDVKARELWERAVMYNTAKHPARASARECEREAKENEERAASIRALATRSTEEPAK